MAIVTTLLVSRSIMPKLTTRLSSSSIHLHRFFSTLSASSGHGSDPVGNSVTSLRQITKGTLVPGSFDTGRYICTMRSVGLEYTSGKELLDDYVRALARVVGSEEEAKKKIYFVSCEDGCFSFGAKIDENTSNRLRRVPGVGMVLKDFYSDAMEKSLKAQSTTKFIPRNWNHRLFNIYKYSKSFKGEKVEDPGHWLFRINQPYDATVDEIADYCVELLIKVLGSKKEARASMYITWCVPPFGFGAEIDKNTATELRGLPDVIELLPDYAFDIKNKDRGVLIIPPPLLGDYLKRPFYTFFEDELDDYVSDDPHEY